MPRAIRISAVRALCTDSFTSSRSSALVRSFELAHDIFYVIPNETKGLNVHYVTTSQLQEFCADYRQCAVMSGHTGNADLAKLLVAKYCMVGFLHITHRFYQLTNPWLHLQLPLEQALPGLHFGQDCYSSQLQAHRADGLSLCTTVGLTGGSDTVGSGNTCDLKVKRIPELVADMTLPTIPTGTAAEAPQAWGHDRVGVHGIPPPKCMNDARALIQATCPAFWKLDGWPLGTLDAGYPPG